MKHRFLFPGPFRRPLARELTVVLAVKIAVLTLAAMFLFGPGRRPHVDSAVAYQHLFASPAPSAAR